MSCQLCEEEPIVTYIRVGNGNVQVAGCEKHLRQLMEELSSGRDRETT